MSLFKKYGSDNILSQKVLKNYQVDLESETLRFKHTVLLSKDFHLCNAISFLGIVASDSENVIKTGKNVIKTDKNVITTDRNFIKNVKNTIKTGKIVINVLQNNCEK